MGALIQDRNTAYRDSKIVKHPVGANTKIYAGSIVVLNASHFAVPATTATGLRAIGRAESQVNNTGGADGDKSIQVRRGAFQYANDGSITRAHIKNTVYLVDDQTVSATNGGGTRSVAGECVDVDGDGVWVQFS